MCNLMQAQQSKRTWQRPATLATDSPKLFHVLVKPVRNHPSDSGAILFEHHHVSVAVLTRFLQPEMRVSHAGLRQKLRRAVIVSRAEGRLAGHDRRWHVLHLG